MREKIAMSVKKRVRRKLHEAALFLLVVDDVERVDDRLHAGVGAPQRDREPCNESKSEFGVAFSRQPRDLFMKDVDRAGGKNARSQRKMGVDRRSVGDQSIKRDERRNGGKDRQQGEKDNAARDGEQPIVIQARIDAPENILPPGPGDLPRNHGMSSPARLLRAAHLGGNRLVVLDLLLRPLVGIHVRRRTGFVQSLAGAIGSGIDCPVRLAKRPGPLVFGY
jgi:hypothetical protein